MVNPWVKRSLDIVNDPDAVPGYLDRLYKVYPSAFNPEREVAIMPQITEAHATGDGKKLLKLLLTLKRFPVEYPYAALLRKNPHLVDQNPATCQRISKSLLELPMDKLEALCRSPKKSNTQTGPMFAKWLKTLDFPVLEPKEFLRTKGPALLSGDDKAKTEFANVHLKAGVSKGLDVVAKNNGNYAIGEAKFLSSTGGNQDRGFDDISTLVRGTSGTARRIGVIDGYVWINKPDGKPGKGVYATVRASDHAYMSALVLEEFILEGL